MKDLTSSVYTFEKLIDGNFLYVDKTEYIWKLIQPAYGQYFLSRPRRFGKSLTVSTLEAIFQGKKELFKGLALYDKPYDWKPYPTLRISFADVDDTVNSAEGLTAYLMSTVNMAAKQQNVELTEKTVAKRFLELIQILAANEKVVILIDEYDKPILGNAINPEIESIQKVLKGFFSVIKDTEPYQRFVLLTGVSKFSHVSVFSDLNNLTDITMEADFATMLGYTQEEVEFYLGDRIEQLVGQTGTSKEEMLLKIKQWYNGYRFEENAPTVYNPVSLAQFFRNKGKFNNYWFQTGTPKFLLDLIKEKKFNCAAALNEPVSAAFFNAFEISNLDPMILLYQTGYLTIEKAVDEPVPFTDQTMRLYYMHFPNREVESSFNDCLLEYYAAVKQQDAAKMQLDLVSAVGHGNVDEFMKILQTMFANIPYDIHCKEEFYYQSLFYLICYMLQVYVQAEVRTNDGRIDMTIQAGDWIYVIEFKLNKSAEEAMKQIKDKDYAQKFQRDGKRIMLIGVNFNSESGQIENWISEELKN